MPPPGRPDDAPARSDRIRWCLGIFVFALALRGLAIRELSGSVLFETIIGDGRNYLAWGRRIAAGDWIGTDVFYQAPLYPYFLGVVHTLLGDGLLATRAVQAVLGSTSCVLLALAGWRFFSRPVGIGAGLVLAAYAPAIFSDLSIQKSVLDVFFVCLILWMLAGLGARPRAGPCLGLGLAIGGLVLTRENALVFPVVLVPWLLARPATSLSTRLAPSAALVLGVALVLAPVALRNWHVGGELHLTTSQLGHNLFIGNNPDADGTYRPVVHWGGDPRVEREDAITLAERALGRRLSASEVSDYYAGLAWEYVRTQPLDWLRLMLQKLVLTFNAAEMIDSKDQYSHADHSRVLGITGAVLHFGVLAPLALLGAWTTRQRWRRLLPLYLLFSAYTATLLVFYVFARYRIPLVPILVLFAAAGVVGLPAFLRRSSVPAAVLCGIGVAAAAVFCNWRLVDRDYMRSVTHYNLGNELFAAGRVDAAIAYHQRALELYAGNAQAHHNLGAIFARRGDLERARAHYEQAIRITPGSAESHVNLAHTLIETGDPAGAAEHYRRALALTAPRADLYADLGEAYAALGRFGPAADAFERALALQPESARARAGLRDARRRARAQTPAGPRDRAGVGRDDG